MASSRDMILLVLKSKFYKTSIIKAYGHIRLKRNVSTHDAMVEQNHISNRKVFHTQNHFNLHFFQKHIKPIRFRTIVKFQYRKKVLGSIVSSFEDVIECMNSIRESY
jgi:hypothetical protein